MPPPRARVYCALLYMPIHPQHTQLAVPFLFPRLGIAKLALAFKPTESRVQKRVPDTIRESEGVYATRLRFFQIYTCAAAVAFST